MHGSAAQAMVKGEDRRDKEQELARMDEPTTPGRSQKAASGCIVGGAADCKKGLVGIPRERYQFLGGAGKGCGKVL